MKRKPRPKANAVLALATKLPVPLEHHEQKLFFQMVDVAPRTKHLPIYAVPNGGHRHKATAGKLKAEGVRAGFPDINVDVPCGTAYHGLRIELKRQSRSLSSVAPAQSAWHKLLRQHGYAVAVCYGALEAWGVLTAYLFGTYDEAVQQ